MKMVLRKAAAIFGRFCDWFEKYLVFTTVSGFVGGIFVAKYSQGFSNGVNTMISNFVDG